MDLKRGADQGNTAGDGRYLVAGRSGELLFVREKYGSGAYAIIYVGLPDTRVSHSNGASDSHHDADRRDLEDGDQGAPVKYRRGQSCALRAAASAPMSRYDFASN